MWDPERCRQEVCFDIRGIVNKQISYDCTEDGFLAPIVRWMMCTFKSNQRIHRDPNITGHAFGVNDAPNKLHYQLETLAVNCLQGVNRTASAFAASLLASDEEVELTGVAAQRRHKCPSRWVQVK